MWQQAIPGTCTHFMRFRFFVSPLSRAGFCSAVFLIALLIARPALALAQDAPVIVRVNPSVARVVAGQEVELSIEIAEARELYGADVSLAFDPAVVEVVDADPSLGDVQMAQGTFFDTGFVLRNAADNAAGTMQFAMTQLNPSTAKSGSGALFVVRLRGKVNGQSSPLTITGAEVAQRDGSKLPVSTINGQVQVVASVTPGPTATSVPTQAAGTPLATSTSVPTRAVSDTPIAVNTATATATALPPAPTSAPTAAATEPAQAASATPTPVQNPTVAPTQPLQATSAAEAPLATATAPLLTAIPSASSAVDALDPTPTSDVGSLMDENTPTAPTTTPSAIAAVPSGTDGRIAQPIEDVQSSTADDAGPKPGLFWILGGLLLMLAAGIILVIAWRRGRLA